MNQRRFKSLGRDVSEIGIGTWQLGGAEWGDVSEEQAIATLHAAADAGVNLIDTADIYGNGRSEYIIGRFLQERPDRDQFTILTKFGRGSEPGWPDNFLPESIIAHTESSLKRLGVQTLNLTQTHCIPDEHLANGEVWETLRKLKQQGKIQAFGASVESIDEAQRYLDVDGLGSLQIIFNVFRQKPIEKLFADAVAKDVALIVRLPLASGLLAGKFDANSTFGESDHRSFNADGDAFNVGETFAGLGLKKGAELAEALRGYVPDNSTMAQWALRWCLDFHEVTTVIPGATRPEQAKDNAMASDLEPISPAIHQELREFYRSDIEEFVRGKY